ncbi:MAG: flagellar biosynthetic protein FliR [Paracoccaceae bacterium]
MTLELVNLLGFTQALLWHGFLVFLRVGAAVSMLPAFGERSVPVKVKLVLALAFTCIVAPAVSEFETIESLDSHGRYVMTETISGLALGIGIRLFVLALQTAGAIAANATSLSQVLGGAAADPLPAISYILVIAGLALAVLTGLHIRAAELLILSYDILPPGAFPDARSLSSWGLSQVARAFSLAFVLAAPFVIVSVIYNLTLGVINKAMPQLMVAFVGAPVITAGGLFVLFLVSPLLLTVWGNALNGFLDNPFGSVP